MVVCRFLILNVAGGVLETPSGPADGDVSLCSATCHRLTDILTDRFPYKENKNQKHWGLYT
jgi:hypothetical protein